MKIPLSQQIIQKGRQNPYQQSSGPCLSPLPMTIELEGRRLMDAIKPK